MKNYFLTKIRYLRRNDQGKDKPVTEQYLLEAVSFTDAEAKVYQKAQEMMPDGFHIQAINRCQVDDLFHYDDADDWYKVKMTYELEDGSKSKTITNWVYLTAHNSEQALQRAEESLSNMLVDIEFPAVTRTKILEVWDEPGPDTPKIPPFEVKVADANFSL